ncbi:hypothetical protein [Moorena sp. SIOASIH]|nr:hypothetical protein [Moorena sp. SIOASIH]
MPIASCPPPLLRGVRGDSSCLFPVPYYLFPIAYCPPPLVRGVRGDSSC